MYVGPIGAMKVEFDFTEEAQNEQINGAMGAQTQRARQNIDAFERDEDGFAILGFDFNRNVT